MTDLISCSTDNKIYTIRGKQVMLDSDLAKLYEIETKVFNQSVKRNIKRFPDEFMFQLTEEEVEEFQRSQFVTFDLKLRKYKPYVFTEQGVSMLSAVLKSETAIGISIKIIQSFVNMRKFIISNQDVFKRVDALENNQRLSDEKFELLFSSLETRDLGRTKSKPLHIEISNTNEFANNFSLALGIDEKIIQKLLLNNEEIKKLLEEIVFLKSDELIVAKEILVRERKVDNKVVSFDRVVSVLEILMKITTISK